MRPIPERRLKDALSLIPIQGRMSSTCFRTFIGEAIRKHQKTPTEMQLPCGMTKRNLPIHYIISRCSTLAESFLSNVLFLSKRKLFKNKRQNFVNVCRALGSKSQPINELEKLSGVRQIGLRSFAQRHTTEIGSFTASMLLLSLTGPKGKLVMGRTAICRRHS
ncbi:hypothetical protein NPIL_340421 [Nephila pilipes]|uniref:Uncharacterized protein n=1 Tax=Nephila pilipes TaxID=299642 RepID=A0A8X6NKV6_NEPPI|nr:hypothetical protein NPIL_340421 [Nephila pilipes]